MDDSAKGRYDITLSRDILTSIGLIIKIYEHVIEEGGGTLKGSTSPMIHFVMWKFKDLNTEKITPE